nr:glutamate--tRNA ligase family protein [Paenibacillus phyllosphaerae]
MYATFISERLAHQSGGVFYLRIEDTDKKREVEGSLADMLRTMREFGIVIDEGPSSPEEEIGAYGPYTQSKRVAIYQTFIKDLVARGLAYPCFCDAEELQRIRDRQQEQGVNTGYYGKWAIHRRMPLDQVNEALDQGRPYVIRFQSPGQAGRQCAYTDLVKGEIHMPENEQDVVIMKSDGIPTYHFAHVIDDYLMGTTHVIRGDEWLSSVPIHHQLFEVLGFPKPAYGHIAPIMKMDGQSKRKFSKRKDPDAAASYYQLAGYPSEAIREYFMTLINAGFDGWRIAQPNELYSSFPIDIRKMSVSGALFDLNKLNDISKDVIARMEAREALDQLTAWAAQYDQPLASLLAEQDNYAISILNLGRASGKPRKDVKTWSDFKPGYGYLFDELFVPTTAMAELLPAHVPAAEARALVHDFLHDFDAADDRDTWFGKIKALAAARGYAAEMKQYKKQPDAYRGHVGDVAAVLRVALTGKVHTPDLYDMLQIMGRERIARRLAAF